MDTDPRAHGNNPTRPRSPHRTRLRAHRHQSKSGVAERPHHSHPNNQAIKIATVTRLGLPANPFVGTTVEMLTAGLVMLLLSLVLHEWNGFQPAAVPAEAW